MPNTIQSPCPHCESPIGRIVLSSQTVMTISCPLCGHQWAVDLKRVSPQVRKQLADALKDADDAPRPPSQAH